MNDSIKYEDFIPHVRESLYGNPYLTPSNVTKHRKSKKVKFTSSSEKSPGYHKRSSNLKDRKPTPLKNTSKRPSSLQDEDDSFSKQKKSRKHKQNGHGKKTPKRKQTVISFSSDSFDEELKNDLLSPSKSEMETFQKAFNNHSSKKASSERDSYVEEDSSAEKFDLDSFYNSLEICDFNESVTDTHSGIDNEFVSDCLKKVKIVGSDYIHESNRFLHVTGTKMNNNVGTEESNAEDINVEIIKEQSNVEIVSENPNISTVVDKIQECMLISNNDNELIDVEEDVPNTEQIVVEFHEFEDRKLVVLKPEQSVSVHGLFTLKILHGKLEIFGSILDKNSNPVDLYSSRGSALLNIKNVTCCNSIQEAESEEHIEITKQIPIQSGVEKTVDIFIQPSHAAFFCIKLNDYKIQFIEKYIPQKIFPRVENESFPRVVFEPTENLNVLKENSSWNKILGSVNSNSKVIIAGGKGLGKSTLLRFAINKLLNKYDKIRVLDLDPGQSEFAVPGCLSIITITEPIFGPNFTHLKQTDRCVLSNINPGHDPRAYVKCVKFLVTHLNVPEEERCPVLVNYMGFVQGIGLNIIASAIKYIRPTDIIQICSRQHNKNFKVDLTRENVEKNSKLFFDGYETCVDNTELNYKLHKVTAMNDYRDGWTLEPRKLREMAVLAYFGRMMGNGVCSLTSHELPMYEIKLSDIKLTNLHNEELRPAAINANMVALCSLEPECNFFICKGYGVVRGIDLECEKLVIITPEAPSVLEEVHYLVIGSVSLPPSIYMTPDGVTGKIPYVMQGELISLGQITKRSYLPANKK